MNQVVVPHEIVNDESVTLVEWLVADGLEVTPAQIVARLESSKGVIDVEAPEAALSAIKPAPPGTPHRSPALRHQHLSGRLPRTRLRAPSHRHQLRPKPKSVPSAPVPTSTRLSKGA